MPENSDRYDSLKSQQKDIDAVFRRHKDRFTKLKELAAGLSADMENLGAFVRQHTEVVCPRCRSVCCINRHSYHTFDDMVFIYAIGGKFPLHTAGFDDSGPCQFLGKQGCTIPQSLRPYRCNWYFCTPLLDHILAHTSRRRYRLFIELLQKITGERLTMMKHVRRGPKVLSDAVDKSG